MSASRVASDSRVQDENAYPGRCLHCGAASCSCAKQQRGGHNGDGMLRPGPAMRKGFLTSTMLREEDEHLKQRIQERIVLQWARMVQDG